MIAKLKRNAFSGHKLIATVKSVEDSCSWGHEVGDTFDVNCHDAAGLCGFLYHDIFPYLTMLQFGGSFPKEWVDLNTVVIDCMDRKNRVILELRRVEQD